MQKKIIALAIVAAFAAPVAMADTANVNVYGSIDGGVRSNTTGGVTLNTMGSGSYNSNRWGIKGSEDLGDGMKTFWGLESSLNTGTGGAGSGASAQGANNGVSPLFDRNASLGVSSGNHAIELGRQKIVAHKVAGAIEPMGFKFRNQSNANTLLYTYTGDKNRLDNLVSYTGTFGEVKVLADHNITTTGEDALSTSSLGVVYESGPLNVTGIYAKAKVNSTLNDTAYYLVGGAYKFGDGKVSGGLTQNTVAGATTDTVTKNQFIGGNYNVTSKVGVLGGYYINTVTAATETKTVRIVLGTTYALSKRTTAYADVDKKSIDAAGTTTDSNGYSIGLATVF